MLARLLVEKGLRVQKMTPCCPRVRGATRNLVAPEMVSGNPAVAECLLQLGHGLVVQPCGRFEAVARQCGNSSGHGIDSSSAMCAYASSGRGVSFPTPAP